jgi:uncharacterized membrane protein YfcA
MTALMHILSLPVAVFLGGLVSGVSGFAFSAVAGAVLLQFYPPVVAVPLMMASALLAQLYSLYNLRGSMEWTRSLPLIAGGVVGMPIGLYALRNVDAHSFRVGFGIFLAAYAAYMLLRPNTVAVRAAGGKVINTAIGFGGGVIGGLTAFPGALPTMWCDIRGLPKDVKRGLTQPYIATMQFFGFSLMTLHGDLSLDIAWKLAWGLPSLVIGTVIGLAMFGKVNDLMFRRIVLSALFVSGLALI